MLTRGSSKAVALFVMLAGCMASSRSSAQAETPKAPGSADAARKAEPPADGKAADKADATERKADDAKRAADEARAEATRALRSAEEAKLESLKTGKFIQYGLTAGVAMSIGVGARGFLGVAKGTDDSFQESSSVTTMPYVLLVPAYWAYKTDLKRAYCAAAYGADRAAALDAAFWYARREAATTLSSVERSGYDAGTNPAAAETVDKRARQLLAQSDYQNCGWSKVGVWVGRQLAYSANVDGGTGVPTTKRTVDPIIAFGGAYAPNAYVTLLFGGALGAITVNDAAGHDRLRRFTTFTIGLGGNLDVLGLLFH